MEIALRNLQIDGNRDFERFARFNESVERAAKRDLLSVKRPSIDIGVTNTTFVNINIGTLSPRAKMLLMKMTNNSSQQ